MAPQKPVVSIVIPLYNKVELTLDCLQSLVTNTPDTDIAYEVVMVDNASSDGTRELLSSLGGDVKVILNDTNEGFGRACNAGAAAGTADYVLFLNNDTKVMPGWLGPLVAALEQDSDLAAVQPKLLFPDGRLNDAGGLVFSDTPWRYGMNDTNPMAPQYNTRRAPDYASGACLLVRKSMFDAVGGFDDIYAPAYYEDTDLSFAFRAHGWRVLYEPRSNVIHVEGGTAGTDLGAGLKQYQVVNRDKFFAKWHEELKDRPVASPDVIEAWAHRDQGRFNPMAYGDARG